MKGLTKWLSLTLAIVLFAVVLSACAQTDRQPAQTTTTPPADPTDPGDMSGPSWTWDTSPVELSLYMHESWYTKQWNPDENIRDAAIFEATGVNLDIQVPTGDAAERLNTMIAGKALPDIIILGWWFDQVRQMQTAGLVHNLNTLIDEYAPDFRQIIPESMIKWYTHEDENWYAFPNFFWAEEHMTDRVPLQTNAGMYARQDIMNELGISPEDFNTQDGMVEALSKVRDARLEFDGFPVRPLALGPQVIGDLGWVWTSFFAVPREDSEGNIVDMRRQPEYLELMKFLNRLYREGLMYDENFVDQRQQITERKAVGEIFAFVGNTADYVSAIRDVYNIDPQAQFVPVGPVRRKDGAEPILVSSGTAGWQVNLVSANTEHPDRAIRLLHYLYSEEGQMVTSFGVEGVTYTIDENGHVQWTDYFLEQREQDEDRTARIYGDGGGLWWVHNPLFARAIEPPPATVPDQLHRDIWNYFGQWVYQDLAFTNIDPPGGTDEQAMNAEIGTYWATQVPMMIMAASPEDVERIWLEALNHIDTLGAQQVIGVINERFNANKDRLGIEHAWPPLQ